MADLSHNSRDTAKDGPGHGKDKVIDKVGAPMPMGEAALHLVVQAGATHLGLARGDARVVVGFVQAEEDHHADEAEEAEGAGKVKGPEEGGVDLGGGRQGGVDGGGDEEDGEVGGEKVGFEEPVEEDEQVEGVVGWGLVVGVRLVGGGDGRGGAGVSRVGTVVVEGGGIGTTTRVRKIAACQA